ncbi:unconventional myosin-IXb [Dasypus novemcinctus]|uniref:unconventional myosin-IXb n=1 Tax=Dasypus novemcinctus TaxID=9361 RepID=UPI0039C9DC0D
MSLQEAGAGPRGAPYVLHVYPPPASSGDSPGPCRVAAAKDTSAADVVRDAVARLRLDASRPYALVEVKEAGGEEWVLEAGDAPVHRALLWPRRAQDAHPREDGYHFVLQERGADGAPRGQPAPPGAPRRLAERGFLPWQQADFDDLCQLPALTEENLLENLKRRFLQRKIYTYAGSILLAVNPFRFLPIYNPKYVKLYENQALGRLEPHIFAVADAAYHAMLRARRNQCVVISGESGSGKTQSTNFLIHCLTALSRKGHASGVERTILGAGPVLEVSAGAGAGAPGRGTSARRRRARGATRGRHSVSPSLSPAVSATQFPSSVPPALSVTQFLPLPSPGSLSDSVSSLPSLGRLHDSVSLLCPPGSLRDSVSPPSIPWPAP